MNIDNTSKKASESNDLFEKKWVKFLLFLLVPGAIFILISAGIRVSQYGIDHTIVVLCQKQLPVGKQSAMRITLIDDREGFFLPQRVKAVLKMGARKKLLFDDDIATSGYAVAEQFKIPQWPTGPATIELHVFFDGQRRVIQKPVQLVAHAPKEQLSYPSDTKGNIVAAKVEVNDTVVRVFPEGRGAPSGLSSLLFVLSTNDKDQPISAKYAFELPSYKKSAPKKVAAGQTDDFGLDAFPILPLDLHFPLTVVAQTASADTIAEAGVEADVDTVKDVVGMAADTDTDVAAPQTNPPKTISIAPSVVYSGMKMDFASPVVAANEDVVVKLQQISGGEPVYLDVFHEGNWAFSTTGWVGDDGKAEIRFRPPSTGVLRIQVTNSPFQFTRNVSVRHLYVKHPGESDGEVLQKLADNSFDPVIKRWHKGVRIKLKSSVPDKTALLVAFSLSRLYKGHRALPTLVSSRKEDDAALNAFKEKFQTGLMICILLLGIAVAVLIAVIAWQSSKRQQRLTQLILEDDAGNLDASDDVVEMVGSEKSSRWATAFQVGTLFLVVIAAFTAIALLVVTLSWN